MQEDRFIKYPYSLAKAHGFVSETTSEFVKLTNNEKLIYSYLKSRNEFFLKEKGGEHYDTQQSISEGLHIDRKHVISVLKKLMEHGVVKAEKKKFNNYMNWRYHKVKDLVLWELVDGKEKIIDTPKPASVKTQVQPKKQPIPALEDDESDLPF